jgi:hypothetical protein
MCRMGMRAIDAAVIPRLVLVMHILVSTGWLFQS